MICNNTTCTRYMDSSKLNYNPYKADVMILGDKVSVVENLTGEMFCDLAGKQLHRELMDVGIDMTTCYKTKAIKCHCNHPINSSHHTMDRELLLQEIAIVQPKFILALGAEAVSVMFGRSHTLGKVHGKLLEYQGAKVVCTYNPSVFARQPNLIAEFRADIGFFFRNLCGMGTGTPKGFAYTIVPSLNALYKVVDKLMSGPGKYITYDIETNGLDAYAPNAALQMLGICGEDGRCYIVPMETEHYRDKSVPVQSYVDTLQPLFERNKVKKAAHYSMFDNLWLRTRNLDPYIDFDTFLGAYLLDVNKPHGLKWMAKTYCGASDYDDDITFKDDLTKEEFEKMAEYCALDVYYTMQILKQVKQALAQDDRLERVMNLIVMPGERVLQRIKAKGVYVDQAKLHEVLDEYTHQKAILEQDIRRLLPPGYEAMNLNSTKQLADLFFTELKLPIIGRTTTGAPTTGKSTLLRLKDYHPIPELLLKYKKYEKAINGFLTPWQEYLKRDGRLHTTYNIAKTATGRLSAEDPNLQQVPRDQNVRNLICAPPGKKFIEADYSQIELRVGAFVAGENAMKDAYRHGVDIHSLTASRVMNVPLDKVTKAHRTSAKAVNFGFLYGMGANGFQSYAFDSYGVTFSPEEAKNARDAYFNLYPGLLPWHERQRREVRHYGHVRTATGRIRHLPEINSPDREIQSSAERKAINTPVQSFASDITMLAMVMIDNNLKAKYGYERACLVGQVHDAIMVEADEDIATEVAILVKRCMESVPDVLARYFGIHIDLPILAEVECGEAWGIGEVVEIPTV